MIGNNKFALLDGRIFRTFKNGGAAELDSWSIAGRLKHGTQDIGGLQFERTPTSFDTVLIANDEKTVLFSDR